ncbi:sulfatase [Cerasicoccus frondis]|uniref:sulfatase n=1 Tax=Cerasicoccus frondis TaxID=490090 RepID=UPI00285255E0|nr:sulfatase [Cerasicoccus frondis]
MLPRKLSLIAFIACLTAPTLFGKNVIFVLVDDLSPRLGCYGGQVVSPNLDKLAEESCLFQHAYAQATICTPSRASIMTGMRPDEVGSRDNNYRKSRFRNFHPDVKTLPQYLQDFGYTSIGLGKTYGPSDKASWSRDDLGEAGAVDQYALPENKAILEANMKDPSKRGWVNRGPITEAANVPDNAYPDGRVTERAVEILHELKDQPFFLYVGYQRPHRPFTAPQKYFDLYAGDTLSFPEPSGYPKGAPKLALKSHRTAALQPGDKNYERDYGQMIGHYAAASYTDALFGQLMATLDELNLKEETLVIFAADHGFHIGENGQWDKSTLFETACAVPLIIHVPGDKKQPLVIKQPVELLDIYPTVLDFLGLKYPPQLAGKSLLPLMEGKQTETAGEAYTEVLRSAGGKNAAMNWDGSIEGRSLRMGDYRMTRWWDAHTGEVLGLELYDFSLPEPENQNLANDPDYTNVQHNLLSKINEHWPLPATSEL